MNDNQIDVSNVCKMVDLNGPAYALVVVSDAVRIVGQVYESHDDDTRVAMSEFLLDLEKEILDFAHAIGKRQTAKVDEILGREPEDRVANLH